MDKVEVEIELEDEEWAKIDQLVAEGKYPSRDAVIESAIREMRARQDPCGKRCDQGSPCILWRKHEPASRHQTRHGCVFYD